MHCLDVGNSYILIVVVFVVLFKESQGMHIQTNVLQSFKFVFYVLSQTS